LENAGIFYGHLEYFSVIWYILWPFGNVVVIWYIFPRLDTYMYCVKKYLANPGYKCVFFVIAAIWQKGVYVGN
jgi:hypothetical protein